MNYKELKWVENKKHIIDLQINNTNVLQRQGHETFFIQMTRGFIYNHVKDKIDFIPPLPF